MQTAGGFKRFGVPVTDNFVLPYSKSGFTVGNRAASVNLFNRAQTLAAIRAEIARGKKIGGFLSN